MLERKQRNWIIYTSLEGMENSAAILKNSLAVSQKLKIQLLHSAVVVLAIYLREIKTMFKQ